MAACFGNWWNLYVLCFSLFCLVLSGLPNTAVNFVNRWNFSRKILHTRFSDLAEKQPQILTSQLQMARIRLRIKSTHGVNAAVCRTDKRWLWCKQCNKQWTTIIWNMTRHHSPAAITLKTSVRSTINRNRCYDKNNKGVLTETRLSSQENNVLTESWWQIWWSCQYRILS